MENITCTITAPSLAAPAASSVYMGPRGLSAYEVDLQNGFSGSEEAWIASLQPAPLSNADPAMNGTADPGDGTEASRDDHVHPIDTSRAALVSGLEAATPALTDYIGTVVAGVEKKTLLSTLLALIEDNSQRVSLVDRSGNPLGSTSSSSFTTTWVWPVPLGALGIHDRICIRADGSMTASANAKEGYIRIGTNPDGITGAAYLAWMASISTYQQWVLYSDLQNLGALNIQQFNAQPFNANAYAGLLAVDFSVQQYLSVTLKVAGGETIKQNSVRVWVERGTA